MKSDNDLISVSLEGTKDLWMKRVGTAKEIVFPLFFLVLYL